VKSENRESAQSADAATRKYLPFQESTTSKFVLTAELVRLLKPLVFPLRNRKKSSASFTAITPIKRQTAATFAHVRHFTFLRKITLHAERRHKWATVGFVFEVINHTILPEK